MCSTDKTSSVWSINSEETGTPFAACNLCSSKIKRGKEWPGIIFKRKCLLFISLATIFSYAHGKKWKFPAKSGRQKIYPRNTRFRSGKIRLTGNKIEIRLFPVRQRNHGTSRFLFTIPNFNARALVATGPVSLYPRDSILCLFILDCTMRDKGPQWWQSFYLFRSKFYLAYF